MYYYFDKLGQGLAYGSQLAGALTALVRESGHVRVTLLIDALPPMAAEVLERAIMLLIFGFGILMLWTGWNFAEFTFGQVSAAVRYPVWIRNAAVPAGGFLISVHALIVLLALGVPIAFTIGTLAAIGIWMAEVNPMILPQQFIAGSNVTSLLAIPGFILAGEVMSAGGLSRRLPPRPPSVPS